MWTDDAPGQVEHRILQRQQPDQRLSARAVHVSGLYVSAREALNNRLSRSLRDVLTIMERLAEAIDTTTPAGRMMMQMVGAFAEFERAMLRERTRMGLDTARREGRIGGRRPKLSPQQQPEIRKMVTKGRKTAADAAWLYSRFIIGRCRLTNPFTCHNVRLCAVLDISVFSHRLHRHRSGRTCLTVVCVLC